MNELIIHTNVEFHFFFSLTLLFNFLSRHPRSYLLLYSSSAIFNGENFVCYATNGIKFGIGGDEVKIGADTVSQSDLGPCSDDIPLPTSAATKAITTSAGASSFSSTSIILSLTVGASIIFGSLIIV